jgi:hypothetical protein
MTRDEIVECTYQAGLRMNELKRNCGLIDEQLFKRTEERIKLAINLTAAVDEILTRNDESARQARLKDLKPGFDTLFNSVINEKVQLDWPAAKRGLRILPLLKLALLDSLPLRRG